MNPMIQAPAVAAERPLLPDVERDTPAIRTDRVYVVHTSSIEQTLTAVRVARSFATTFGVPVTVVHIRAIPYALPVDEPTGISPVEADAFLSRLRAESFDVSVREYLCRDRRSAVPVAFKPHSLIVVAGRRRWWRTQADFWRRTLEAAGHFVVFVETAELKEHSHA